MDIETVSMTLIAHAGEARRLAFEALAKAKTHDFTEADVLITESEKEVTLSHQGQTDLLINEAKGVSTQVNVLLVHSQDHLMTSMLAIDLIKEMIILYKELSKK